LQILLIFSSPEGYTGYTYILRIRYGTVLANTAVLCMPVCIVCLPVRGAPWWVLLQHSIMLWRIFLISIAWPSL